MKGEEEAEMGLVTGSSLGCISSKREAQGVSLLLNQRPTLRAQLFIGCRTYAPVILSRLCSGERRWRIQPAIAREDSTLSGG